jgi:hypothetical protein
LPTIKIDLDHESFRRLTKLAVEERRPIPWQAEVLLLRVLGLPAPVPLADCALVAAPAQEASRPEVVHAGAEDAREV